MAAEGQVHLVGTNRDLLMGEGTRYDMQDDFNPFIRQQRADQGGPRPYAHGSWLGAEWTAEVVVPLRVIANGSNKNVPTTRAAIQDMIAAFRAVGATGEIAELRFHLEGDDQEFLMFGRPRGPEPDLSTLGLGYVYASAAFVAADPRIYSGTLTTVTTGMAEQAGGLVLPARPATARMRLPGAVGSYASTPDHASLDITGDIEIEFDIEPSAWAFGTTQTVVAKFNTAMRAYAVTIRAAGELGFGYSVDGTALVTRQSTVAVTGNRRQCKIEFDSNNGAAGHTVRFWTRSPGGTYTQLGADVTNAGVITMHSGAAPLEVGANTLGTGTPMLGVVHSVTVRNAIGGTAVANPNFTGQAPGATSFTDSTGKLWTLNGSSRLVGDTYKGGVTLPTTIPGRLVGGSITLTNAGDTAAPLLLRIDGPVIEPWILVRRPDGTTQSVRFDLTLAEGQWITVDSVSRQALLNDQPSANQRGLATWDMDEYPLLPGVSTIRFGGAEFDPDAELTASARSAWA